jgi:hypothetical protein
MPQLIVQKNAHIAWVPQELCSVGKPKPGVEGPAVCVAPVTMTTRPDDGEWIGPRSDQTRNVMCGSTLNKPLTTDRPTKTPYREQGDLVWLRRMRASGAVPLNRARKATGISPAARWTDASLWTPYRAGASVRVGYPSA